MPTYEYRCKACGHQLEVVQGFTDAALTKCPTCGKKELRKVFSAVGISFKGSGFYKNDSRGSSKTTSTSSAGESSGSSSESSSTSSSSDSSSTSAPSTPSSSGDAKTA